MSADFTGQKFEKLTVIKGIELNTSRNKPNIYKKYLCLCDCGKEIKILTSQLIRGTKSCGCLKVFSNLTDKLYPGLKINRFTVVGFSTQQMKWELLCDCGTTYFSGAKRILRSNTKSCGCLNRETGKRKAIELINKKSNPDPIKQLAKKIFRDRYKDGDLTPEIFFDMSQMPCEYCGMEAKFSNSIIKNPSKYSYLAQLPIEKLTFRYNGLDRIDSNLPHTKENCVPACKICNHAKSDLTQQEFLNYLNRFCNYIQNSSFEEYRKLANYIDISFFSVKNERKSFKASIKFISDARYSDGDLKNNYPLFYKLSQLPCYYCGLEYSNKTNRSNHRRNSSQLAKNTGDFIYNGLDRIDSSLPHNYDNIIPCCKTCNRAKLKLSFDDFMDWKKRIKTHQLIY